MSFSLFLYRLYIIDGAYDAKDHARKLNVPLSTFYSWIEGTSRAPCNLGKRLYWLTQDQCFLDWYVKDTDCVVVKVHHGGPSITCPRSDVLQMGGSLGQIGRDIDQALSEASPDPSTITREEWQVIEPEVTALQKRLAALRVRFGPQVPEHR